MYTEIFDYVANSASKLWQVQKIAFALVNQKVQMKVQMNFFAFAFFDWQMQMRKNAFVLVNEKVQMHFFAFALSFAFFQRQVQMHLFAFALSFAFFQRQVKMQFFAFAIILIENLQHIRLFLKFWNIFEMVVMGFWVKKTEKERFRREFGCKLFWKRLTWPFFFCAFQQQKKLSKWKKSKGVPLYYFSHFPSFFPNLHQNQSWICWKNFTKTCSFWVFLLKTLKVLEPLLLQGETFAFAKTDWNFRLSFDVSY